MTDPITIPTPEPTVEHRAYLPFFCIDFLKSSSLTITSYAVEAAHITVFVTILPLRAACKTYSATYLVTVLATPPATMLVIKIFLYQYI